SGTGGGADGEEGLGFGATEFVDLESDSLQSAADVDLVFDVIGGDIQKASASLVKPGGTLVSVVGPVETPPENGRAVDFVVEADRNQLGEIATRVSDGRLRSNIGTIATLDDAVATLNGRERAHGKTIIQMQPSRFVH